jgi:hypothetical protein
MVNLKVADHIRYASQDHGGVVILDTAAGEWVVLNETAGDLWRCWDSGGEFDKGVEDVAGQYPEIPPAEIRADARQLLNELVGRGIVEVAITSPSVATMARVATETGGRRPGRLRVIVAMLALGLADLLARCSFRVSLALVRLSRRGWCDRVPTPERAARTVEAVSAAAQWYPGRAACLEQSLAAVLLAATVRCRLDWCLGWLPDPYRFHAWVAVEGQPVPAPGEAPALRSEYDLMLAT